MSLQNNNKPIIAVEKVGEMLWLTKKEKNRRKKGEKSFFFGPGTSESAHRR